MALEPEWFTEPGRWVGDHDLVALALAYRLEIHCYTAVYQAETEEKVYSAGEGVHPRAKLHLCLTNQRFWPIVSKDEKEEDAGKEKEDDDEEGAAPSPQ
eukprot:604104-Rhodomonas_salina.1